MATGVSDRANAPMVCIFVVVAGEAYFAESFRDHVDFLTWR